MKLLLAWWEKENKDNNVKHCHDQHKIYLFVLSVDGILGMEAIVLLANLILLMATKTQEPILHVSVWING